MHYGKHGWKIDDNEKYTHLDIFDPKTRSEMTKVRREAKYFNTKGRKECPSKN
jgi:hypothetical protein